VAIVNVAVRLAPDVFSKNAKFTVPFPVPLPPVTISQEAELAAVQLHAEPVVIPTVPVPPAEVYEAVVDPRV